MIAEKMLKALNVQIQEEMYSAYLYLSMAADFEAKNLSGFAQWMKEQSKEEINHAMKLYGYINERGGKVELQALEKPQGSWDSPLKAFEAAYHHEKHITGCIDKLIKEARDLSDNATEIFLQWYVSEQVEEEDQTDTIVQKLNMIKGSSNGLYMLDRELSHRGE